VIKLMWTKPRTGTDAHYENVVFPNVAPGSVDGGKNESEEVVPGMLGDNAGPESQGVLGSKQDARLQQGGGLSALRSSNSGAAAGRCSHEMDLLSERRHERKEAMKQNELERKLKRQLQNAIKKSKKESRKKAASEKYEKKVAEALSSSRAPAEGAVPTQGGILPTLQAF
jgi:hypothetical protein